MAIRVPGDSHHSSHRVIGPGGSSGFRLRGWKPRHRFHGSGQIDRPAADTQRALGIGCRSADGFGHWHQLGPVRAGNAGSKRKFKYSPLGNTVNLASRVQGATKYLKTRLLVTGSTAERQSSELLRRKVAEVQMVNIQEPVPLWELSTTRVPPDGLNDRFDSAMLAFENEVSSDGSTALRNLEGMAKR